MPDNTGSHRVDGPNDDKGLRTGDPRDDRPRVIHDETRPSVRQDSDFEHRSKSAKTSAAAAFALVFGVSALICVLAVILSPVGLVLSIVGIILGVVGMKMAKKPGVTGKGVAIGGLVLSVLALLGAISIAIGLTTFLNNEQAVTRLENTVSDLRGELPTSVPDVDVDAPDVNVN